MVPVGMTGEEVTPVALPVAVVAVVASVAPVTPVEAPVPVAVPEAASVPVEAPVDTSTLVVLAVGWRCRCQHGLTMDRGMGVHTTASEEV